MTVESGTCDRCHHGALLYPAKKSDGKPARICYECREIVRKLKVKVQ